MDLYDTKCCIRIFCQHGYPVCTILKVTRATAKKKLTTYFNEIYKKKWIVTITLLFPSYNLINICFMILSSVFLELGLEFYFYFCYLNRNEQIFALTYLCCRGRMSPPVKSFSHFLILWFWLWVTHHAELWFYMKFEELIIQHILVMGDHYP